MAQSGKSGSVFSNITPSWVRRAVERGLNMITPLGVKANTEPAAQPTNQIQIYSKDSSDGSDNATLGLMLEQDVEVIGTFTASHKVKVWINGVEYWMQLDAV